MKFLLGSVLLLALTAYISAAAIQPEIVHHVQEVAQKVEAIKKFEEIKGLIDWDAVFVATVEYVVETTINAFVGLLTGKRDAKGPILTAWATNYVTDLIISGIEWVISGKRSIVNWGQVVTDVANYVISSIVVAVTGKRGLIDWGEVVDAAVDYLVEVTVNAIVGLFTGKRGLIDWGEVVDAAVDYLVEVTVNAIVGLFTGKRSVKENPFGQVIVDAWEELVDEISTAATNLVIGVVTSGINALFGIGKRSTKENPFGQVIVDAWEELVDEISTAATNLVIGVVTSGINALFGIGKRQKPGF